MCHDPKKKKTCFLGNCDVNPKNGTAVTDDFFITCDGWIDDHQPLSYFYYTVQNNVVKPFKETKETSYKAKLPVPQNKDGILTIFVDILDRHGSQTTVQMNVTVSLFLV